MDGKQTIFTSGVHEPDNMRLITPQGADYVVSGSTITLLEPFPGNLIRVVDTETDH